MMKRMLFAVFAALLLLLPACTATPDEEDQEVEEAGPQETTEVAVFVPDSQAEYLIGAYVTVPARESLPEMLIDGLISKGALPAEVEIQECRFLFVSGQFELDLNDAFLTALESSGSAGETMMLYSVVNTFLFNYPTAQSLILTVNGDSVETEHGAYTEPFTEMQYLRQ